MMQDIGRQILLNVTKEAMNAHSMLPCISMEDATHLTFGCSEARFQKQIEEPGIGFCCISEKPSTVAYCPRAGLLLPQHNLRIVDEQIYVDPDDVVDPDETQGQARWNCEVVQGTGTQEVVTLEAAYKD